MATNPNGKPNTICLAAFDKECKLVRHEICRPDCAENDVSIEIVHVGMCHSDVHAVDGSWGVNKYPLSPGHEIAGTVKAVGSSVKGFKAGDRVGVGCMVQSCNACDLCSEGLEQHCPGMVQTYSSVFPQGRGHDDCSHTWTNGGYSTGITVDAKFVFAIPDSLSLEHAAPLLCAGATTYSPLARHVKGKKDARVAVLGFGGLGHLAVKIAVAMGAEVTVLSRSDKKREAAKALGAGTVIYTDEDALKSLSRTFDVILDTVPVAHDIQKVITTLKVGAAIVMIGGVPAPFQASGMALLSNRWKIEGSLIAGVPETAEMLQFCADHKITPEIKVITADEAPAAFHVLMKGESGAMRHVIDMKTLK